MNWHKTLQVIYSKLESNGFSDVAHEIHEGQLSGGTAGEIFDIVVTILISIKNNQTDVYEIIKSEVDSLIDYGKSIGYLR